MAGMCGGVRSVSTMAIFSRAVSMETKPCCEPTPPRSRDVDSVTAGDTRPAALAIAGLSQ